MYIYKLYIARFLLEALSFHQYLKMKVTLVIGVSGVGREEPKHLRSEDVYE